MTSEYPPPGMGVGRVREAKEPLVPMGVLVWIIILDKSLGLGSLHLLGLISVYLGPLELLQLLEEAGGGQGAHVSVFVSVSPPQSPVSLSTSSVAREIWIWGSLHSHGRRVMLKALLLTFYGTFGQGVKVTDPIWKSRPLFSWALILHFARRRQGRRTHGFSPGPPKEAGHSPCPWGPLQVTGVPKG